MFKYDVVVLDESEKKVLLLANDSIGILVVRNYEDESMWVKNGQNKLNFGMCGINYRVYARKGEVEFVPYNFRLWCKKSETAIIQY